MLTFILDLVLIRPTHTSFFLGHFDRFLGQVVRKVRTQQRTHLSMQAVVSSSPARSGSGVVIVAPFKRR